MGQLMPWTAKSAISGGSNPDATKCIYSVLTSNVITISLGTRTVRLQAKDAANANIFVGGSIVTFGAAQSGGTCSGISFGSVVDNGDGTYDCAITGTIIGLAVEITATIDGQNVTTTKPTVRVNQSASIVSLIDFEDGTFAGLRGGSNQALTSLTVADPYLIDSTTAARGVKSLKRHVANVGASACEGPNQSSFGAYGPTYNPATMYNEQYVRFGYMQSTPFDNGCAIKVLRIQHNFDTILGSVMHNASGSNRFQIHPEDVGVGAQGAKVANMNLPAPTPNDFLNSWHWFEFYINSIDTLHTDYKMWIDDIQYFDYSLTLATARANAQFNHYLIGSTFNSIKTDGNVWYDHIEISAARMGIPA